MVEQYPPEDIADFKNSGLTLEEWRELQALAKHNEALAAEEEKRRLEKEKMNSLLGVDVTVDTDDKYEKVLAAADNEVHATSQEKNATRYIQDWWSTRRAVSMFEDGKRRMKEERIKVAKLYMGACATRVCKVYRGWSLRKKFKVKKRTLGKRAYREYMARTVVQQNERERQLERRQRILAFHELMGEFTTSSTREMLLCERNSDELDVLVEDMRMQVHMMHDEVATVHSGLRTKQNEPKDLGGATAQRDHLEGLIETHVKRRHNLRHQFAMDNRRYRAAKLMSDHAHNQIRWMESEQHHINHILKFVTKRLHELGASSSHHTDVRAMSVSNHLLYGYFDDDEKIRVSLVCDSWLKCMQRSKMKPEEEAELPWLEEQLKRVGQQLTRLDLEQEAALNREIDKLRVDMAHKKQETQAVDLILKLFTETEQYERERIGLERRRIQTCGVEEGDDAVSLAREHNLNHKKTWNVEQAEKLMREMQERNLAEVEHLEKTVIFIETEQTDEHGTGSAPPELEVTTIEKVPSPHHFHEKEWRELYQRKPWKADFILRFKSDRSQVRGGILGIRNDLEERRDHVINKQSYVYKDNLTIIWHI